MNGPPWIAAAYLALGGAITFGFGVAYLLKTARMARMVGITLSAASARADYRAIYAGSQIGVGIFFILGALIPAWAEPALVALALFAAGFGVVRLGSLGRDRVGRDPQWIVGVLEVLGGVIAGVLAAGPY